MILFFYGEDTFRLKHKLNQLKEKFISSSLGDTNLAVLDGKTATFDEMTRQILAIPFLARKRLVIIENLLSEGEKETQEKVAEFLKKVPETTVLVFAEYSTPDKRTALFKRLNLPGKAQEFKSLEGENLRRFVKSEVARRGGEIESLALSKLIEYVGSDLWRMKNEIDKLTAYGKRLTAENIELLVAPQVQSNIFNLIDAATAKNSQKGMAELYKLFSAGLAEVYILTMLVWGYRNLLVLKDLHAKGTTSQWDLAKKGGISSFVVGKNLGLLPRYTSEGLKIIYEKLLYFESVIKTGKMESRVALELLVFQLTQ